VTLFRLSQGIRILGDRVQQFEWASATKLGASH
jgi:hypothetical protein